MAQGFSLIADPVNTEYRNFTTGGAQAYTIGDLVQLSRTTGGVTPATSASLVNDIIGVAMETNAAAATSLLCSLVRPEQRWTVSCTNAPVVSENFQRMVLTNKSVVNNTHTDDATDAAVVTQLGVKDATGKIIVVSFNNVSGVSA